MLQPVVGGHGHHAHAVGQPAVDRLQALVIEGFGQQHSGDGLDELRVGDITVLLLVSSDAGQRVLVVFAAEAHHQVQDGAAQ